MPGNASPEKLRKLIEVLQELGVAEPDSVARSQLGATAQLVLSPDDEPIHPARRLVEFMLVIALWQGATKIVFEPQEADYRFSCWIYDVEQEASPPPRELAVRVSRIFKAIADLDLCSRAEQQRGQVQVVIGTSATEFQIDIEPTPPGERVVATVLNSTVTPQQAEQLLRAWGMDEDGSCPLGFTEEEQRRD